MNLETYKQSLKNELRPRTVTFFQRNNGEFLVGYKKRGFGKGNYVGIGGKVETDKETIRVGAAREIGEEIEVDTDTEALNLIAILYFYFPHIADESYNQVVYAFRADGTSITPHESEEIRPEWKDTDQLPELYERAWDDARYWWEKALTTSTPFMGEFLFDNNLKVIEHEIRALTPDEIRSAYAR